MKKLPLGIQTFSQLIEEEMLYIDKTMYVQKLVQSYKYVFLSRPRRFGKSLLISTMMEFFNGNKALFEGLTAGKSGNLGDNPVIRIDFSRFSTTDSSEFVRTLLNSLGSDSETEGLRINSDLTGEFLVKYVIALSEKSGKRVVILIDEYDKPIVDNLDDLPTAEANREILRNFYGVIKSLDEYIEFMFITGVSKFAKVSVFSGLNQISDITLDEEYAGICGYTQEELDSNFGEYFKRSIEKTGLPMHELTERIKQWYNGYSWDGKTRLYNPYAILSFFSLSRFRNYWFETGTPDYLLKLIKREKYDLNTFDNLEISSVALNSEELQNIDIKSILFQTGYLTIDEVVVMYGMEKFKLRVPNYEVQNSLYTLLFANLTGQKSGDINKDSFDIVYYLDKEDIEGFITTLKSMFAQIPSNLYMDEEKYFHSLFIMMMYMSGIRMETEVNTNIGRIDGVIEFSDKIYLLEFKFKSDPGLAINQIMRKRYYEKYLNSGKKIILVGATFSREEILVKSELLSLN